MELVMVNIAGKIDPRTKLSLRETFFSRSFRGRGEGCRRVGVKPFKNVVHLKRNCKISTF